MLRVLVSDADWLNRASRGFAFGGASTGPEGLDQVIGLLNRERQNDRLYVGLFAPSPTMLWDDKEMPNVPLSQINIVDGRPGPGSVQILRESLASEMSVPMGGPVSGVISLNLPVREKGSCQSSVISFQLKKFGEGGARVVKINEIKRKQKWIGAAAALAIGALLATARVSYAEHTRRWKQSTYEEFLKGTTHGVAVRSDGRLELAPKFTQLADADASYLWAVKLDSKGTPYAAGGSPAKVIRLDSNGKPATVFQSADLSAQAIAFDSKGTLYVGTSPDGKVYKVSANGDKTVFFEPKTKYIWDLAFAADGTLYVATGDKGQIYAVAPDGKSELFYSSDEAHIRVLAFDGQGNLIAGTEPSGRVLRLTKKASKIAANEAAADGFVLYETPKREVTALTVGADGTIYAAPIGERQHNAVVSTPPSGAGQGVTVTSSGNVTVVGSGQDTASLAGDQRFGF